MGERLIELLLGCLHTEAGRVVVADLAALSDAEWDGFLALAAEQRIRPLLYQRLKERGLTEAVPERILQSLRAAGRQTALRTMGYQAELVALAQELAALGIPLIALKGIYLAHAVYANPALREMNDIDVLVHREDLPGALSVLRDRGYTPLQEIVVDRDVATMHHLPRLVKPAVGSLELHWSLCAPGMSYTADTESVWDRCVPVSLGGGNVFGLAKEDLLLHLCLHTSYQHEFAFGLRPSCDIAAVIAGPGAAVRWPLFVARTRKWGWQRGVWLALATASELVGAAVPPDVLDTLRPDDVSETLLQAVRRQIFTPKAEYLKQTAAVKGRTLRKQPGLRAKLAYTRRTLFPSPETIRLLHGHRVQNGWLPHYYVAHWSDFARRFTQTLTRFASTDARAHELLARKDLLHGWLSGDNGTTPSAHH